MRCNKAQEYLSLEIDDLCPPDSTIKLREHLDGCADCREYQADLQMGRRLLDATEPQLSDNFDWRLQLKLNRTLQASVGEVAYPWEEKGVDRWAWLRNFGTAAAVGLAAVLTVAMFVGQGEQENTPFNSQGQTFLTEQVQPYGPALQNLDRRSLSRPAAGLYNYGSQTVSTNGQFLDRGWSGQNVEDLQTINRLRIENAKLHRMLFFYQHQLNNARAHLDTTPQNALDLKQANE